MRRTLAVTLALVGGAPSVGAAQGTRLALGPDTSVWLGIGGQLRVRAEGWSGFGFRTAAEGLDADTYGQSRLMAHAELRVRGTFGLFVQVKSSLTTDRALPGGVRASDEDRLDLQQAYAEMGGGIGRWRVDARAGRADLRFGRERLISPSDWGNTRRTFQGASARATSGGTTLTGVWVRPVRVLPRAANEADPQRLLYGLVVARQRPARRLEGEVYWLRHVVRASGGDRRHTLGGRVGRRPAAATVWDWDVEAAAQWGTTQDLRRHAWMAAAQAGWSPRARPGLRLTAGLDAASGAGADVGTWAQLYPLGHAWLGYADVHGRQNVIAAMGGASLRVREGTTLQLDAHQFWRASTSDGVYGVDGSPLRGPGAASDARAVGSELDLTARHQRAGGRLVYQAGASVYRPGAWIRETGSASTLTWAYAQLTATW